MATPEAAVPAPAERPASLWLVFGACVYDGLLCLGLLFVASLVATAANGGEAIPAGTLSFQVFLLAVPFPYFALCWMRGGHTLGMRAWRLRIAGPGGGRVTLLAASLRYLGALLSLAVFALGFFWLLLPPHKSWHDHISDTRILRRG